MQGGGKERERECVCVCVCESVCVLGVLYGCVSSEFHLIEGTLDIKATADPGTAHLREGH